MDNHARIRQNNPAILRYYHHFPFHYYLRKKAFWSPEILKRYAPMWNWSEIPYFEKYNTELLKVYEGMLTAAQWEEFTREVPVTGPAINEYVEKIDWKLFCEVRPINDDLIRMYPEKICWKALSGNPKTSYYILEHYHEKSDRKEVSKWVDKNIG